MDFFGQHRLVKLTSQLSVECRRNTGKPNRSSSKATGKKEDEHVVASDAELDAKLEVSSFKDSTHCI